MGPLESLIRETIARDGPITVERYMSLALGHPEHGYYHAAEAIGAGGDFTTAPEISQMFGEMLGLWSAVVWQQMGSPSAFRFIELGPGRGTLMADMLRAAATLPGFDTAARVHLVETSARLRDVQRKTLEGRAVDWHESLADVPAGPAIIIANEFLDALPVRQYVRARESWCERQVAVDATDTLSFVTGNCALGPLPEALAGLPAREGEVVEHAPARMDAARAIAARLATAGGGALVVDYGYDGPAAGDTLQAVADHKPHPVLQAPGTADLTAHVDFNDLRLAAAAEGVSAYGPLPQGRFLTGIGIEARAAALLRNAPPEAGAGIESGLRRLTGADGMGELFKAFAMTPAGAPVPPGFEGWAAPGGSGETAQ